VGSFQFGHVDWWAIDGKILRAAKSAELNVKHFGAGGSGIRHRIRFEEMVNQTRGCPAQRRGKKGPPLAENQSDANRYQIGQSDQEDYAAHPQTAFHHPQ
jgi:hypothetical protein